MTASQCHVSRGGWRVAGPLATLVAGLAVWGAACAEAEPFRTNAFIATGSDAAADRGAGGGAGSGTVGPDANPGADTRIGSGGSGGMATATGTGGGAGGSGGAHDAGNAGTAGSGGTAGIGGSGGTGGAAGAAGTGGGSGGQAGVGTGGSGGSTVDGCFRGNWTFTASKLCDTSSCVNIPAQYKDPPYAIDGNSSTRYTSGRAQGSAGQEMVVLTFAKTVTVSGLNLMTTAAGDGPAAYRVEYATTGTNFVGFIPAVTGAGSDNLQISFPATAMKAIRVTQTGSKPGGPWWSIHELTVVGCLN